VNIFSEAGILTWKAFPLSLIFAGKKADMIEAFKNLSREEQDYLLKVPVMLAILIAGVDDDIDDREMESARKWAQYKRITSDPLLIPYYELVYKHFEENMESLIMDYPSMASLRNPIIKKELEKINPLFEKLDPEFAVALYESLRRYAKYVAEASGGFLGFFKVSPEEKELLDLPMIKNPAGEK